MANLIFQHVQIIHIYIRHNLVPLTPQKIFGVYLHAIMKHAGLQYRIVSGRSANTEKEEAMFRSIKTDTKLTSETSTKFSFRSACIKYYHPIASARNIK